MPRGIASGQDMHRRLIDIARLTCVILTVPVSRWPVRPLGDEDQRPLPGDELMPDAHGRWTNGVTIHATPERIWPWLAQMGCRRAGWYSYDGLDNGEVPSAERILPEMQRVEIGDIFPWTPAASDGFIVAAVEPPKSLVLRGMAGTLYKVTWAFALDPIDEVSTRMLARSSGRYANVWAGIYLALIVRPIHFGMQRKQLLNIKRRVEASTA